MANQLEVHFVGGDQVVIEHEVAGLGRAHVTASGLIEAKEFGSDRTNIHINPERITFVRDLGPQEKRNAGTHRESYMRR